MKSTKFHCLALMTKSMFKTMDVTISSWILKLIIKTSYLNNYSKSFFFKSIILIFSLIKTTFLSIYKNIIRLLAWHIKFEKRKELKKTISQELMAIVWHPNRWDVIIFTCQKMRKNK